LNPKLHSYGIAEEQSDIRAHVTFPGRRVTVYRTADMVRLIKNKQYRMALAEQPCVTGATGQGYLVPIDDICPSRVLPLKGFPWYLFDYKKMNLTQRGDAAMKVVMTVIRANIFPLWLHGEESNKEENVAGIDIVVNAKRRIQVKCDWGAYPKAEGGTGNLFVQTAERNPRKLW